ncbi:unnamed protein product [Prunus armeniaca]
MIDALMVTAIDCYYAHSTYSQKLYPKVQSDRLAVVDSSLSIALALQQAKNVHQFSILEFIKSANTHMEELKKKQEQLELRDKIAVEGALVLSAADVQVLDAL